MNQPDPSAFPFPEEFFAGYADGELAPSDHALVESYLRDHPEAHSFVEQQFISGSVPTVSEEAWARVFAGIERGIETPPGPINPHRSWRTLAAVTALAVTLAGLFLLTFPTDLVPVTEGVVRDGEEPILLAAADEVEIFALDESAAPGLLIGRHPLAVTPFVLATFEEVDLRGVEPDARGEYPELQMTPPGAAAPMIWAKPEPPPSKP